MINCYPDELNQVWTNLIHNALQAMHYDGSLTIRVFQQGQHVVVAVTDSGEGISEEIQQRIFEPFVTTKSAGEGSGLGLDIVKKIIEKHHGEIAFESSPVPEPSTIAMLFTGGVGLVTYRVRRKRKALSNS